MMMMMIENLRTRFPSVDELKPLCKDATEKTPLPLGEGGRRPGEGKKFIDPHLLTLARKLRKEQTNAEQLLWQLLRNRQFCGLKFRRQYPLAPYVLDFYCDEERLGIELEGGQHNESQNIHLEG